MGIDCSLLEPIVAFNTVLVCAVCNRLVHVRSIVAIATRAVRASAFAMPGGLHTVGIAAIVFHTIYHNVMTTPM